MLKWIILCLSILSFSFLWKDLSTGSLSGIVVSAVNNQPLSDVRVRIQGQNNFALTNSSGFFTLAVDFQGGTPVFVTAGKKNWYNEGRVINVGDADTIKLDPLPVTDNPDYTFKYPEYCKTCHSTLFDQWKESKHARAVTNPMLKQIYNGTDINGKPGVYPGFKLSFPNEGGDCGDCHAPTSALLTPGNTEMNDVWQHGGVDTNGVYCDFCHKINSVTVNYNTGVNGSITVHRPADNGRDINIGQFDDVTTFWMGGTYNEVFEKSAFCSGCHQYANKSGLIVDDTYDSWAASDYAKAGIQCQDCHMKPNSLTKFAGGIAASDAVLRDSSRIYNQRFRGGTDTSMLKKAVTLRTDTSTLGNILFVKSLITNSGAGHKLPTGVSFRNIILWVTVTRGSDTLEALNGDTIDFYAGKGNPWKGNLSGLSGKGYTMLNKDSISGEIPAPNWISNKRVYDNRIKPMETDTVTTAFAIETGDYVVHTKLIYRAVYKAWADKKGWDMREFIMADTSFQIHLERSAPKEMALHQNYPNPFNGATQIRYAVHKNTAVELNVFNVLGQKVKTLQKSSLPPGEYFAQWDGRDENGRAVASGLYIYRLSIGNKSESKKLLYIK